MPPIGEPTPEQAAALVAAGASHDATIAAPISPAVPVLGPSKTPALSQSEAVAFRSQWIAAGHDVTKFDAAMTADGFAPVSAAPAEVRTAADYRPNFGDFAKSLSTERLAAVHSETREWAARMNFDPIVGKFVIEHLSEVGPAFQRLSPAQQQDWVEEQREIGTRHTGSEAAYEGLKARAIKALAGSGALGEALAQSAVLSSFYLLACIGNLAAMRSEKTE